MPEHRIDNMIKKATDGSGSTPPSDTDEDSAEVTLDEPIQEPSPLKAKRLTPEAAKSVRNKMNGVITDIEKRYTDKPELEGQYDDVLRRAEGQIAKAEKFLDQYKAPFTEAWARSITGDTLRLMTIVDNRGISLADLDQGLKVPDKDFKAKLVHTDAGKLEMQMVDKGGKTVAREETPAEQYLKLVARGGLVKEGGAKPLDPSSDEFVRLWKETLTKDEGELYDRLASEKDVTEKTLEVDGSWLEDGKERQIAAYPHAHGFEVHIGSKAPVIMDEDEFINKVLSGEYTKALSAYEDANIGQVIEGAADDQAALTDVATALDLHGPIRSDFSSPTAKNSAVEKLADTLKLVKKEHVQGTLLVVSDVATPQGISAAGYVDVFTGHEIEERADAIIDRAPISRALVHALDEFPQFQTALATKIGESTVPCRLAHISPFSEDVLDSADKVTNGYDNLKKALDAWAEDRPDLLRLADFELMVGTANQEPSTLPANKGAVEVSFSATPENMGEHLETLVWKQGLDEDTPQARDASRFLHEVGEQHVPAFHDSYAMGTDELTITLNPDQTVNISTPAGDYNLSRRRFLRMVKKRGIHEKGKVPGDNQDKKDFLNDLFEDEKETWDKVMDQGEVQNINDLKNNLVTKDGGSIEVQILKSGLLIQVGTDAGGINEIDLFNQVLSGEYIHKDRYEAQQRLTALTDIYSRAPLGVALECNSDDFPLDLLREIPKKLSDLQQGLTTRVNGNSPADKRSESSRKQAENFLKGGALRVSADKNSCTVDQNGVAMNIYADHPVYKQYVKSSQDQLQPNKDTYDNIAAAEQRARDGKSDHVISQSFTTALGRASNIRKAELAVDAIEYLRSEAARIRDTYALAPGKFSPIDSRAAKLTEDFAVRFSNPVRGAEKLIEAVGLEDKYGVTVDYSDAQTAGLTVSEIPLALRTLLDTVRQDSASALKLIQPVTEGGRATLMLSTINQLQYVHNGGGLALDYQQSPGEHRAFLRTEVPQHQKTREAYDKAEQARQSADDPDRSFKPNLLNQARAAALKIEDPAISLRALEDIRQTAIKIDTDHENIDYNLSQLNRAIEAKALEAMNPNIPDRTIDRILHIADLPGITVTYDLGMSTAELAAFAPKLKGFLDAIRESGNRDLNRFLQDGTVHFGTANTDYSYSGRAGGRIELNNAQDLDAYLETLNQAREEHHPNKQAYDLMFAAEDAVTEENQAATDEGRDPSYRRIYRQLNQAMDQAVGIVDPARSVEALVALIAMADKLSRDNADFEYNPGRTFTALQERAVAIENVEDSLEALWSVVAQAEATNNEEVATAARLAIEDRALQLENIDTDPAIARRAFDEIVDAANMENQHEIRVSLIAMDAAHLPELPGKAKEVLDHLRANRNRELLEFYNDTNIFFGTTNEFEFDPFGNNELRLNVHSDPETTRDFLLQEYEEYLSNKEVHDLTTRTAELLLEADLADTIGIPQPHGETLQAIQALEQAVARVDNIADPQDRVVARLEIIRLQQLIGLEIDDSLERIYHLTSEIEPVEDAVDAALNIAQTYRALGENPQFIINQAERLALTKASSPREAVDLLIEIGEASGEIIEEQYVNAFEAAREIIIGQRQVAGETYQPEAEDDRAAKLEQETLLTRVALARADLGQIDWAQETITSVEDRALNQDATTYIQAVDQVQQGNTAEARATASRIAEDDIRDLCNDIITEFDEGWRQVYTDPDFAPEEISLITSPQYRTITRAMQMVKQARVLKREARALAVSGAAQAEGVADATRKRPGRVGRAARAAADVAERLPFVGSLFERTLPVPVRTVSEETTSAESIIERANELLTQARGLISSGEQGLGIQAVSAELRPLLLARIDAADQNVDDLRGDNFFELRTMQGPEKAIVFRHELNTNDAVVQARKGNFSQAQLAFDQIIDSQQRAEALAKITEARTEYTLIAEAIKHIDASQPARTISELGNPFKVSEARENARTIREVAALIQSGIEAKTRARGLTGGPRTAATMEAKENFEAVVELINNGRHETQGESLEPVQNAEFRTKLINAVISLESSN